MSSKPKPRRKPSNKPDAPDSIPDPGAERLRTATLLMAGMLADRPIGTALSFQRISHAALAAALLLSGGERHV
jgi:hypothetical protein